MNGLNWSWILVGATVPVLVGLLVAYPMWRMNQPILGNIAGSVVIFGVAIALIMREHATLDREVQACIAAGYTCWPDPSLFTRYSIYAGVALVQVMALFSVSLRIEHRLRRRGYDPEWR